ncbi:2-C-methyl-D-erythritol 4-phosphate cytidylyltransferase [Sphingobacterium sp. WM]|uniref:2-C-methyl-D-erythritol 4-phosphate cytidylyltransferase n=1 Tax=Sphingobacterium sp. WM TaxID=3031802 RepID=UPI00240D529B|nr:2-C-methyl-D-erythritol 4-phosphate cytidylyltransferase [Sphingobacterium sp. WM]WFB64889.1 2-C-methyl-D-erythritol 4-phosphate cytidylyltransferase [Sphingobacterium sp. WM]
MSTHFVIIVAAGTGSRIGGNLPKQFLLLQEKPILMHTVEKFANSNCKPQIILVLSEQMIDYWKEICQNYKFNIPHHITIGGNSRFQSVKNGIEFIRNTQTLTADSKIAVHDAARPLVSSALIDNLFLTCNKNRPAVIPAVQSTNSVRLGNQENSHAVDRQTVWLVQTPQLFMADLLVEAYEQPEEDYFTDDASVVEKLSNNLYLLPGEYQNLKITFEEDLAIAQLLFNKI